jgi:hypothetical protein
MEYSCFAFSIIGSLLYSNAMARPKLVAREFSICSNLFSCDCAKASVT